MRNASAILRANSDNVWTLQEAGDFYDNFKTGLVAGMTNVEVLSVLLPDTDAWAQIQDILSGIADGIVPVEDGKSQIANLFESLSIVKDAIDKGKELEGKFQLFDQSWNEKVDEVYPYSQSALSQPLPPSPEVPVMAYQSRMEIGQQQTIALTANNVGGPANPSYLDISFSPGLDVIASNSSSGTVTRYDPGSIIWQKTDTTGPSLTSSYLLYELVGSMPANGTMTLNLTVNALAFGQQWIKYRVAFNFDGMTESNYNPDTFVRASVFGDTDQQGFYAYTLPISVTSNTFPTLVAYWTFDEGSGSTALDSSGKGHTLTSYNGATFAASGVSGSTASLDGADDRWETSDASGLDGMYQLTLDAWIFPREFISGQNLGIIAKWGLGMEEDDSYFVILTPTGTIWAAITGTPADPQHRVDVFSTRAVSLNQWTRVTVVYDGSSLQLYLNGVLDSSVPAAVGPISDNGRAVFVGRNDQDWQSPGTFSGYIDEVKVFHATVSPRPVAAVIPGDADSNGAVNVLDLTRVVRMILLLETETPGG